MIAFRDSTYDTVTSVGLKVDFPPSLVRMHIKVVLIVASVLSAM